MDGSKAIVSKGNEMTEQSEFTDGPPVSEMSEPPEQPPKRGPGRPKGSKTRNRSAPKATGSAPRRGRPPGQSRKARIGGMLTMFNMALQVSPLRGDALDPLEIDALSKALDDEARKSPTFARYLDIALGVGGAGGIWSVLALIAMRRGARHGILPPMFDQQASMLLQLSARSNVTPTTAAPDPIPFPSEANG